jgi:Tol biopolymer transport system component
VQPIESGQARCLTSDWNGAFGGLDWLPDGNELVFNQGGGGWFAGRRLFRMKLDGGEPQEVGEAGDHAAAITIRGTRVVYLHARTHPASIWRSPGRRLAPSDRDPEELITSSGVDDSPAFSPDGTRVAFTSYRGGAPNIWVANSDGTDPVQLTHHSSQSGTPNWSPDGRWIVFDSDESGNWDLWVVSAEEGAPRQLTMDPSAENLGSWSRDGRWIYFTSDRGGEQQIWRMPADGGEAIQITQGRGFYARESRDGRRLYYTDTHTKAGIWTVPAGGGTEIEVVSGPLPMFHDFALSGSGIYYVTHSTPPGTAYGLTATVHFLDFDSGETTEVFRRTRVWGLGALAVSPDEEWILYRALPRPEVDLVLVDNFH